MKLFKSKEYKYFKRKLQGVYYAILDHEFKRFKTLEIREEIRQEYDNIKARIALLQNKKEEEAKKGLPKNELARIDDEIVLAEAERDRFEKQIKGLDREVYGAKPSADEPNGFDGIEQTLESFHELEQMLKDYIKRL
jgi:hypothetical protein